MPFLSTSKKRNSSGLYCLLHILMSILHVLSWLVLKTTLAVKTTRTPSTDGGHWGSGSCPHSHSQQGSHIPAQCSWPFPVSRGCLWCWCSVSARHRGSGNPNWQDLPGKHLAITAISHLRLTPFWPGVAPRTEASQDSQKFGRFTLQKLSVRNYSEQLNKASCKCHQRGNGYSCFT